MFQYSLILLQWHSFKRCFNGKFVLCCCFFLSILTASCGRHADNESKNQADSLPLITLKAPKNTKIGFFTPEGSHSELVNKMQFGMVLAHSPLELEKNLQIANGTSFKVNVDFSSVAERVMDASSIKMRYRDTLNNEYSKSFVPLKSTKLRQILSDEQLMEVLNPYLDVMQKYSSNVGVIFLADEPYLNGIGKSEMERAGRVVRNALNMRNLNSVKLGVIFAGGMFDKRFATMIDRQAGEFAKSIDQYYKSGEASEQWISTIKSSRLTTYDNAGNMYIEGGIPNGYDVVSFDFYLSTILLDSLHDNTLSWFATYYPDAGCSQFKNKTMKEIRSGLSFFGNKSMQPGTQKLDRELLDSIYHCRMQAVTTMLLESLKGRNVDLLMISESSNNGVLEFDEIGNIKQGQQPSLLIEARVLDEVVRAQRFFLANQKLFSNGLMFFTYENTYDKTINLNIGGASAMPSVMDNIINFSNY